MIKKSGKQRYLINTGFHFGDWIIPSVVNEQGFTDGPASAFLTMNYVGSSLLAADADMFAEICELVEMQRMQKNTELMQNAVLPGI